MTSLKRTREALYDAQDAVLERGRSAYVAMAEAGLAHRPGVVALLDVLARHAIPRAVATSTRTPLAQRKLAAAGLLAHFDAVCTSSDVEAPKPAPDVYLLAAARLGGLRGSVVDYVRGNLG